MTKEQAALLGLKRFDGPLCPQGHSQRYVRSGSCCDCSRIKKRLPVYVVKANARKRTEKYRAWARDYGRIQRKKEAHKLRERAWRRAKPAAILVREAKKRARGRNLPFNLTTADLVVPATCPALGIPLRVSDGKLSDNSPTIDRLVPERGYVFGNIAVISYRANAMKRNGTLDELKQIVAWLEGALRG